MTNPLAQMFKYSETKGFKLFFSMDLYAAGNACSSGTSAACGGVSRLWSIFPDLDADELSKAGRLLSITSEVPW
jgi:hypothetical protein